MPNQPCHKAIWSVSVDNQNCSFCEVVKNVERISPLCSSHQDGPKTYMECLIWCPDEEVMTSRRCSIVGKSHLNVGSSNLSEEF